MKLFLDISSSCTGYALAEESDGKVTVETGAFWFEKDASIADKCVDLFFFVTDLMETRKVDYIVYERYSFNTKNPNGSLVCPQLQGAVFTASKFHNCAELEDITPQTWRKNCGLKRPRKSPITWKEITESYFRKKYKFPEKMISNVTGRERTVPNDLFDALGVCEGWYRAKGFTEFEVKL